MKMFLFFCTILFLNISNAQKASDFGVDAQVKETIYTANKAKVLNYSMKDFDKLFFEFNEKKFDSKVLLTKEEFYMYTMKIAAFSDRLAALYPKEKETAEASKRRWFSESYEEYLLSKQSQKK